MTDLATIIAAGVARYQASLPYYAVGDVCEAEPTINITLTDDRQRELCLNCPLVDCVGICSPACPIRIEQRAEWRRQKQGRLQ